MAENIVLGKSYKFALRIVRLYGYLTEVRKEFVMSKKLLSAGTDVGAYVKSAQESEMRSGFISDMSAALKKASLTQYWLQLLRDGGFLEEKEFDSIHADCLEMIKLLTSIVKTSKGIN